jgi:long-chain acyl-CoA synthetase
MLEELKKTAKDAKLKGFEMIRNVSFDPDGFTIENELMTPSMKLKRPQLKKKFEKVLDDMYAEMKR